MGVEATRGVPSARIPGYIRNPGTPHVATPPHGAAQHPGRGGCTATHHLRGAILLGDFVPRMSPRPRVAKYGATHGCHPLPGIEITSPLHCAPSKPASLQCAAPCAASKPASLPCTTPLRCRSHAPPHCAAAPLRCSPELPRSACRRKRAQKRRARGHALVTKKFTYYELLFHCLGGLDGAIGEGGYHDVYALKRLE